jgi:hypothetical protein
MTNEPSSEDYVVREGDFSVTFPSTYDQANNTSWLYGYQALHENL